MVEVGGAEGVVLDELDVVVLGQVALELDRFMYNADNVLLRTADLCGSIYAHLSVVADAVDHCDAKVLDGTEQVIVSDEVAPHRAAVGQLDLLTQVICQRR